MALSHTFFFDGCAHYDQVQNIYTKWTNSFSARPAHVGEPEPVPYPAGRQNPYGLFLGSVSKTLAPCNKWVVGWALNMMTTNAVANGPIYSLTNCGQALGGVNILPDWTFALYAGNGVLIGTSQATLPGFSVHTGTWYYFECMTEFGEGSSGQVSVSMVFRVNGQIVATSNGFQDSGILISNLINQSATGDQHIFVNPALNLSNSYASDFYIYPLGVGGAYSTFLGDLTSLAIFPNGDVLTEWTANPNGPHFSLVNSQFSENSPGYIASDTPNQEDKFTWQPIPAFNGSIILVHCGALAWKDDEGSRSFQLTNADTINTVSPVVFPGDTPVYYFYGMDIDPNTGAPWTQAGFNSSIFGIKLIS